MNSFPGARMLALGTALPERVVTNDELAISVDTRDGLHTGATQ